MVGILSRIIGLYGHKFLAGMTRSGKTFLGIKIMEGWHGPALFFNPQEEDVPGSFLLADRYSSIKAFDTALRKGKKINYIPSANEKVAEAELKSIVSFLHEHWKGRNLLFCADECQDFARQGTYSPLLFVARRGLRREIHGLFIAQSPADVSKVIVRQSIIHIIFETTAYDAKYFNDHKLPGDLIVQKLAKGGKHSFVLWNNRELTGPYKV